MKPDDCLKPPEYRAIVESAKDLMNIAFLLGKFGTSGVDPKLVAVAMEMNKLLDAHFYTHGGKHRIAMDTAVVVTVNKINGFVKRKSPTKCFAAKSLNACLTIPPSHSFL